MLRRFCDRCAAEMPMEQTMGDDELILRKINGRPFDLCEECQRSLQKWRISSLDDWYEMVGAARGAGKRYAGFNEEDADDKCNNHAE